MNDRPIIQAIDKRRWRLDEDITIKNVTIPAGFVTDLASIPPIFFFIGHPTSIKFQRASVVHDYLLQRIETPKCRADRVFYDVLIEDGVPMWKAKLMYFSVRFFS